MITDFTFAAIDAGVTETDRQHMLQEFLSIPDSFYLYNKFRGCRILHVYNGLGSRIDSTIVNQRENSTKGSFAYTDIEMYIPKTKKILKEKIFPWMSPVGRINILRTAPNQGLNLHLDSKESEVGTRQHKYRLVLSGDIDRLFFIDKHGNQVYVPQYYSSYVLDGTHLHSLEASDKEKITLCIGTPWNGEPTQGYINLLSNASFKMNVSRPSMVESAWLDPYYKERNK